MRNRWRLVSFDDLIWAKALIAALASARSVACSAGREGIAASLEAQEAAYRTPAGWYVVRFYNDETAAIAFAAFVQCLVTKGRPGYGELLHRLPPKSRRVFPRYPRKRSR